MAPCLPQCRWSHTVRCVLTTGCSSSLQHPPPDTRYWPPAEATQMRPLSVGSVSLFLSIVSFHSYSFTPLPGGVLPVPAETNSLTASGSDGGFSVGMSLIGCVWWAPSGPAFLLFLLLRITGVLTSHDRVHPARNMRARLYIFIQVKCDSFHS